MGSPLTFESAWAARAEDDLALADYTRRRLVLRRQRIGQIARAAGWRFLRFGEPVPTSACLLVGISLGARRDLNFLDLLRARAGAWLGREVLLYQVDKPYVLPLPRPAAETPALALFEDHRLAVFLQGDEAFRFVMAC